ncbi:MAG: hypothetical protein ACYTG0_04600 [Planctomycetota bacterium]
MSTFRLTNRSFLVGLAAAIVATATLSVVPAWAGECCSSHKNTGGHDHGAHATAHQHADHQQSQSRPASIVSQPPHGGQVHATKFQYFEAVYLPRETRVYLYGADQRPMSARKVQGQIAMQVRGYEKTYRYPLKYIAGGTGGQECLSAAVDVSRVRDGDMTVSFHLASLPYQQEPQVAFSQTFALTQARPTVTVARLAESDRPAIAKQRVCPVSGGQLGTMGTPVKLLVGNQPIYLCCQGCIGKVRANPKKFVAKPAAAARQPAQGSTTELSMTKATAADQAAIQAQGACPVMNARLGSMGTPIKVTRGGQSLFLCCQGCVSKVEKNPDHYFARAARMRTGG